MKWISEDSTAAQEQGWDVFEVWDAQQGRFMFVIQKVDANSKFISDEAARYFVKGAGTPLAQRALFAVYQSAMGA